jgi:endonuclease I
MTSWIGGSGESPAGEYERHRNTAMAQAQGNRNPLIDLPQWAERIDFEASLRDQQPASISGK